MHVFKIYLYKRQTKKRNLFICLFFFHFFETFVLVLFRTCFFSFFSCVYVASSFFEKLSNLKKNFVKLFEIVVVLSMWYFIKVFAFEFFMSTSSNIIIFEFFFFFKNTFSKIFSFSRSSSISRRCLSSFYFFSFFLHLSAAAPLHWAIELFQQFVLLCYNHAPGFLGRN